MNRALLVAAALASAACGDTTLFDPMERQPKSRAFSANPFFEDGRSMQKPPQGAVPRERIVGQPALAAGRVGGKDVEEFPLPVTKALVALGRKKFDIHCAACHGILGDGKSLVAANMSLRPPPSLHERKGMPVGHYYQVVANGFGLMPGYRAELTVEERWAVVAYVAALQLSQSAPVAMAPAEERDRLTREKR